jgi:hypothetical protein
VDYSGKGVFPGVGGRGSKRPLYALIRSSGGTDSETSTTVCSEGSKAMYSITRAVHEGAAATAQDIETHQDRAVEHATRSKYRIVSSSKVRRVKCASASGAIPMS